MASSRSLMAFDIVTIVFAADLPLLDLQARSFARFLPPELVNRIHVTVNDPAAEAACVAHVETMTRPLLGPLADRLIVRTAETPAEAGPDGWMAQQAAKLAISAEIEADNYLILDAKNHLIRPLRREDLFEGRRARWTMSRSTSRMRRWMANSRAFFGLEMPRRLKIPPSMPPFMVRTGVARALVGEIEARSGKPLGRFFADHGNDMTEFMLYAAYLASLGKTKALVSATGVPQPAMRRATPAAEGMPAFAERLAEDGVWLLSVHRRRFLDLEEDRVSRAVLVDAWTRGLFDSREAAEAEVSRLTAFYQALRGMPEMGNRRHLYMAKQAQAADEEKKPSLWSRIRPHLRLFAMTYAIGFLLAVMFIA
ncbi:DUF6492 family protein [Sphingomonas sp. ID0503]|uniref:DUF6492 family protein n=1 Tax=Sphingomonas sp. ID0503 TaxID=3399691 RepID=UPI003AFB45CA